MRSARNDDHGHGSVHPEDGGLTLDLPGLLGRRRLLTLLGAGGAAMLVGCGSDGDADSTSTASASAGDSPGTTGTTGTSAMAAPQCSIIEQETAGPFPGDGSNGPDVLAESEVVRRDIRSSIGSASGVADGVPLTVDMIVLDTAAGCAPLAGAAVYLWQCDREGRYSLYSDGVTEETYLRGVQVADADGRVSFRSIFPGAYPGRWPHIHFEVYRDLASAPASEASISTSQIALPPDACTAAYTSPGYESALEEVSRASIGDDGVFGDDGAATQLPTWSGDVAAGFGVELSVAV